MYTAQEKAIIIALLRRASQKWGPRYEVMREARIERGKYMCSNCKGIVGSKQFNVDHVKPVIPLKGFDSWDGFITRLFCPKSGLQILCKPCHKEKTNKENKKR